MSTIVTISPREIQDLVYRCCRVAGCDPGSAELIATNVTFAEVQLGGALSTIVPIIDRGDLAQLVHAHQDLAAAEAGARSSGGATVATFDSPVPLAAIAASLWEMAERGALTAGEFRPTDASVLVDAVTVRPGDVGRRASSTIAERWGRSHREGLVVDQTWFNQLERMAGEFLVAESTLDALD